MTKHITAITIKRLKYSKGATRSFEDPYICDNDYILSEVKGISGTFDTDLRRAGLVTTKDLLSRCRTPVARNAYAEEIGMDPNLLLKWTKMADLMRIEGIGQQMAELLLLAGVDSVKKLSTLAPELVIDTLQNPGSLPIRNLKIDDEFDVIDGRETLRRAAKLMVGQNLPDLVVCEDKKPMGVLTFRNIVRALADGKDVDEVTATDVMVKDAPLIKPDTSIEIAAEKLISTGLPVLPVVENGDLIGVLSRYDIEDVFLKISKRRPSVEEVGRWVKEAKHHKPIIIR
ncbi:MAG: DUF4332 domain-containing protein [Thermoplasmata archaeon]|nr:MAG: DUF4332 domain-containing protein [Thermoplasmata archaeon]